MNRIQVRSPYFIKHTETNLSSIVLRLFIYTGTQMTDQPSSATYQLQVDAYNEECVVDVSEMIEDYINIEFDGTYTSQMLWIDYAITPTTQDGTDEPVEGDELDVVSLEAYEGFRYFEEGAQNVSRADDTNKLLITSNCIYKGTDASVRIPVIADSTYNVSYIKNGDVVYTDSITASDDSADRIKYISNEPVNGVDNYKERVLVDGGTIEESYCLESFLGTIELYDLDYILIGDDRVKIKPSVCSKYNSYKITFVNKFGALQDVYFNGKSEQSMAVKSESKYRSNTRVSDGYSINKHNTRMLTKNGSDTIKLSTGFVVEDSFETFKELELSKQVWIEKDNLTLPITLKDSTFKYKTSLNDKLINYTVTAEFSFKSINNIR